MRRELELGAEADKEARRRAEAAFDEMVTFEVLTRFPYSWEEVTKALETGIIDGGTFQFFGIPIRQARLLYVLGYIKRDRESRELEKRLYELLPAGIAAAIYQGAVREAEAQGIGVLPDQPASAIEILNDEA